MFGKGRFGKNRFAGGTAYVGVSLTPDDGFLTFAGYTPAVVYHAPPIKLTWVGVEVVHSGVAAARVSNIAVEVIHSGVAAARVSNIAVEVVHSGVSAARVSTIAVEVLRSVANAPVTGYPAPNRLAQILPIVNWESDWDWKPRTHFSPIPAPIIPPVTPFPAPMKVPLSMLLAMESIYEPAMKPRFVKSVAPGKKRVVLFSVIV